MTTAAAPMIGIDRILEGLSKTLEDTVLPALPSGYARGQLFAVLEVLGSLTGQLEFGGAILEMEDATLCALLGQAAQSVGEPLAERCRAHGATSFPTLAERLVAGRAILCEIIEGGHADDGALAAAVTSFLANDTILKAMALRPGRLAEISEG